MPVLISKPVLQFLILHPDHDRTRDDRQRGERPADCQAGAQAPGEHLAEMGEINRMAHTRADTTRHQTLCLAAPDLRQPAELCKSETAMRELVQKHAATEQNPGWNPAPSIFIE